MALQVVKTPNQPTLLPTVARTPVQPTLSPSVNRNPVQPTLAPTVQRQPTQPQIQSVGPIDKQVAFTPKMTVTEFGKLIKQKYPEYSGKSDDEIGQAMLSRYPEYQAQIITPQSSQQTHGEKGVKGFALGVTKGAVQTGKNLLKAGSYLLGRQNEVKATLDHFLPDENLKAEGGAEKAGKFVENVAEFFLPAGLIGKASKGIETLVQGLNLGSKATRAVTLAGKAALNSAEAGAITAAQGGDAKEVKTAAVTAGAFTPIAQAFSAVLKKLPQNAWTQILKRTPTETSKNPNLAAQASKTGLAGGSRQQILDKANEAIQTIEVSLDDLLSNSKAKINTAKIAGYLSDLRDSYALIPGEENSVQIIDDIASQLFSTFKKGQSMTPLQANELKRNIYQVIAKSYGKGALEIPAKIEAQKIVAAGLKREIEKIIPEAKTLNAQQAVYLQVRKALEKAIPRTQGKGIVGSGIGLYDILLAGVGTGAGALAGNPFVGLGLVALKKTGESTAVLSSASKLLNYFDSLSPTKKLLFYQAVKGLLVESVSTPGKSE